MEHMLLSPQQEDLYIETITYSITYTMCCVGTPIPSTYILLLRTAPNTYTLHTAP